MKSGVLSQRSDIRRYVGRESLKSLIKSLSIDEVKGDRMAGCKYVFHLSFFHFATFRRLIVNQFTQLKLL